MQHDTGVRGTPGIDNPYLTYNQSGQSLQTRTPQSLTPIDRYPAPPGRIPPIIPSAPSPSGRSPLPPQRTRPSLPHIETVIPSLPQIEGSSPAVRNKLPQIQAFNRMDVDAGNAPAKQKWPPNVPNKPKR